MRRAVVDLNVLISALIAPGGTPAGVLVAWLDGHFELAVSDVMLRDLNSVLARPKFRKRVAAAERAGFVALLREHALVVSEPATVEAITGDPEDDRAVAVARAVGAALIVSGDRHLLDQASPQPPVLTPAEFLRLVA